MMFVCVCLIQHIVACCSGTRCVVKKFHCVCVCAFVVSLIIVLSFHVQNIDQSIVSEGLLVKL